MSATKTILTTAQGVFPMHIRRGGNTVSNLALSSAYSYGVSGAAYAFAIVPVESGNLTDFWVAPASFTGNWAATDGLLNFEVREGHNGSGKPGATLVGSAGTFALADTDGDKWVHVSGLSIALTAGKIYWLVIGDADGNGTNYVTMHAGQQYLGAIILMLSVYTTANGFSTAGSSASSAIMAVKVGGQMYCGALVAASTATSPSNQRERGNRVRFSDPVLLVGFYVTSAGTICFTGGTLKIRASTALPADTPLMAFTFPTSTLAGASSPFPTAIIPSAYWFEFKAGVEYIVTIDPPTATTAINKMTSYGSLDADLRGIFSGFTGATASYVEENLGNGTWVEDTDAIASIELVLAPLTLRTVVG